ncbi:uncharacterized protein ARMOST_09771 [Armillaria ostoyae]|uniref:Uncharacterized protein n=1 Tax=Armillaria ostoyae TaxID=47428 RepID=A0A284RCH8_ARMOS|nr:uncharacterized protein ARMOST_09771 [Armillaria ostoyae]
MLNSLLSQDNLDESDESSVAELIQRLESADGVAKGMESKLDDLLGNLDTLLAVLEKNEPVQKQEEVGGDGKGESASKILVKTGPPTMLTGTWVRCESIDHDISLLNALTIVL